jgi:uncharacterized membrane protein (UPF0127 family)
VAKTKLIVNLTGRGCVCVAEIADRPLGRMRGLMGRRGLAAGEGLLLSPAPAIHTAFMRFPIDAVFLDHDLTVLAVAEKLRPWRFASDRRAKAVLELPAGECARRGVNVGDALELRERVRSEPAIPLERERSVLGEPGSAIAARGLSRAPQSEVRVARAWPLRILVVSSDPHFQTAMSLLLARRNCSVTLAADAARVSDAVDHDETDVVLIDTSQEASAPAVATLTALDRSIGVVLTDDEAHDEAVGPEVLAKWGPFEDLISAIERASRGHASMGESR